MAKQYISSDNNHFLKTETSSISLKFSSLVWHYLEQVQKEAYVLETQKSSPSTSPLSTAERERHLALAQAQKAAQKTKFFLSLLGREPESNTRIYNNNLQNLGIDIIDKSSKKSVSVEGFSQDLNRLTYNYHLAMTSLNDIEHSDILVPVKAQAKYLKPKERGLQTNPHLRVYTKEAIACLEFLHTQFKANPQDLKSLVRMSWGGYGSYGSYGAEKEADKQGKEFAKKYEFVVPAALMEKKLKEALFAFRKIEKLVDEKCSDFDPKEYKLQNYVPPTIGATEDIEAKKAYYLFSAPRSGGSGFLTLIKTKHARTMYEWGLSPSMDAAFLFQAPLEHYEEDIEGFLLEKTSQVFVNMEVVNVQPNQDKAIDHPTLEALKVLIDKKDITHMLDKLSAPTPAPAPVEEKVEIKKRHKI